MLVNLDEKGQQRIDFFHWKKLLSAVRWAVCIISLILTAPIHCRGSVGEKVMQCWISPTLFQWRNKRILDWPESIFSAHFRFWVNCIMIFFLLIESTVQSIWLCTNLVTIYLFIRSQFNLFFNKSFDLTWLFFNSFSLWTFNKPPNIPLWPLGGPWTTVWTPCSNVQLYSFHC